MSKQDDVFIRQFTFILVLLVIFAFCAYFLAANIATDAEASQASSEKATLERIRAIGQVKVAAPMEQAATQSQSQATEQAPAAEKAKPQQMAAAAPAASAPAASAPAASEGRSADVVYRTACMACHAVGVANAPKTGDKAAWETRAQAGMDAMVAAVINGKGAMPPNGANPTLTKDEITRAVKWFLDEAGVAAQ